MAELGALSLRIEENGGDAVLAKVKAVDAAAKIAGVSVDTAAKALTRLGISAKVSGGQIVVAESEVARASSIVKQLGSDAVVTAGQVDQAAVSVGRLGTRAATTDAAVTKMSPKLRSGASAISALAIAAATGGGSLTGMATQAGLVGSVMAAEFAPAKWAGYAAGIGAVVIGVTALIGIMKKLREEQAKPSELVTQRIADIKIADTAEQEFHQRRLAREQAAAALDKNAERRRGFLQPHEQAQALTEAERLKAQLKKAETIEAEALKRFQQLRNAATKDNAELAKQAIQTAAESSTTVRLSTLAKEQAAVEAAFQAGTKTLAEQYDERRRVIVESEKAERAALEAARAQKLKPVAGETPQDARGRQIEAGAISAQITALAADTQAKLTALTTQRAADEKALAAKVIAYEAQVEAVKDRSFEKRREQIQAEAEERRKVVFQQTGDEAAAETARAELVRRRTDELLLQKAQTDLSRLQTDLDNQRAAIQQQLTAGVIDEAEASKAIADIEQSAVPEMQKLVELALQFAAALGDEGAVAALKKIKVELGGLGIDLEGLSVLKSRAEALGDVIRGAIEGGFARGLGRGGLKGAFQGLLSEVTSGFGSIAIRAGLDALKVSALMKPVALALASLNPFAAIAAGVALVALGTAMGGSGGGGGGGYSGSSAASAASTPITARRLIIDPNAGMKQRLASAGSMAAVGASAAPQVVQVIGINTPRGQELIGTANDRYTRRRS